MFGNDSTSTSYLSDVAGLAEEPPAKSQIQLAPKPPPIRIVPNEEDLQRMAAQQVAAQTQVPPPNMSGLPYGAALDYEQQRWGRFGMIDGSVIALSMLAGFSLDKHIAKRVGVKGYGPLIGAVAGNALSDGISAIPEGTKATLSVTAGAMLPLVPVLIAMKMKKPMKGNTAIAVGLTSSALLLFSFRDTIRRLI